MPDDDIPPEWLRPGQTRDEIATILRTARAGALYIDRASVQQGWVEYDPAPAAPLGDASETLGTLMERGFLTCGAQAPVTPESGESVTADRVELTETGRDLWEQVAQQR